MMPPKKNKKTLAVEYSDDEIEGIGEMSEDGKLIVAALSSKIDRMKMELCTLTKIMKEKDEKITKLDQEVINLKGTVEKLEERIDDADAYERRDTLLFSGEALPPTADGENSSTIVCEVIRSQLGVTIQSNSISTAHRLGKKPIKQGPDRRPIIVKFCRRETKQDIVESRRAVRPTKLYINESLTPLRNTIMYVLRRAKRQYPEKISGCTSIDGKVYVWTRPPDPNARNQRTPINNHAKLVSFCSSFLECPLSNFISEWPH